MFPYILYDDIDVAKALRNEVPKYLRWLQDDSPYDDDESPKFSYNEVEKVDVVAVDTTIDTIRNIDVWGVGLRVWLLSGQYFLVYLPMYNDSALEDIYEYWSEITSSIDLVDGDTNVFQLPQMKVWRSNKFHYDVESETFSLTKEDLS